jgi:hypothetical protein
MKRVVQIEVPFSQRILGHPSLAPPPAELLLCKEVYGVVRYFPRATCRSSCNKASMDRCRSGRCWFELLFCCIKVLILASHFVVSFPSSFLKYSLKSQHCSAGLKYQCTISVDDRAREKLFTIVQTPSALLESRVLVTISMNGTIRWGSR